VPGERLYKYNPTPTPTPKVPQVPQVAPLLPKLFVPQDHPELRKPPPALKLEKAPVPRARKYSYSPTPYPVSGPAHPPVRTPIYKGKIVFIDKP